MFSKLVFLFTTLDLETIDGTIFWIGEQVFSLSPMDYHGYVNITLSIDWVTVEITVKDASKLQTRQAVSMDETSPIFAFGGSTTAFSAGGVLAAVDAEIKRQSNPPSRLSASSLVS